MANSTFSCNVSCCCNFSETVEKEEAITGTTLDKFVKAIKLFGEMSYNLVIKKDQPRIAQFYKKLIKKFNIYSVLLQQNGSYKYKSQ
jgi:hypothetical protein